MSKLQETTPVTVSGVQYYIRPFPAFKAAKISGDVLKILMPFLDVLTPMMGKKEPLSTSITEMMPSITRAFSTLSGDELERVMKELLLTDGNIAAENASGDVVPLDNNMINELFCGEAQDMYVLAYHVIRLNFGGFFKRLGLPGGSATEPTKNQR